jgi:hypothetical protein
MVSGKDLQLCAERERLVVTGTCDLSVIRYI